VHLHANLRGWISDSGRIENTEIRLFHLTGALLADAFQADCQSRDVG
jgi:hypothetical protein